MRNRKSKKWKKRRQHDEWCRIIFDAMRRRDDRNIERSTTHEHTLLISIVQRVALKLKYKIKCVFRWTENNFSSSPIVRFKWKEENVLIRRPTFVLLNRNFYLPFRQWATLLDALHKIIIINKFSRLATSVDASHGFCCHRCGCKSSRAKKKARNKSENEKVISGDWRKQRNILRFTAVAIFTFRTCSTLFARS